MKAKDLRIGNLIYSMGSIVKVNGELLYYTDTNKVKITDFYGIELTEEWLVKFGFEYDGEYYNKGRFSIYKAHIEHGKPFQNPKFVLANYINNDWIVIEYVHQLQNLYFALTGTEL